MLSRGLQRRLAHRPAAIRLASDCGATVKQCHLCSPDKKRWEQLGKRSAKLHMVRLFFEHLPALGFHVPRTNSNMT